MLTQIDISNLVTIQTIRLTFGSGTTAITGETGTGKSILLDAIALALGSRASGHPVRPGTDRADITLTFDTSHLPAATDWLNTHDLSGAGTECMVRRVLTPDGRSRSYVNGVPLPLARARELAEKLIHIHGQHEQQTLLQTDTQLMLLDGFADSLPLAEKVSAYAMAWRTLHAEIAALREQIEKDRAQSELLQFQLNELQALHLVPEEFQKLDIEQKKLSHADESLAQLNQAVQLLNGNEQGILSQLKQVTRIIASLQALLPDAGEWHQTLEEITIQLNDLENTLTHEAEQTGQDPERLATVEARLSTLFDLARKHRIPPEQLFSFQQQLAARLHDQQKGDEHLAALISQSSEIENQYQETAQALSVNRQQAARKLEKEITAMFRLLALKHAEFSISLEADATPFASHGLEKPVFLIRTSPDQPMQPLATIASGGELSRISLAIHIASARQHATPTLIFDEVDTGIGGGTAEIIGKLLRQLGNSHQVFCVTHTPQVAAQSHHHVQVKKQVTKETARTEISQLTAEERIDEIARMLGGIEITRKTLAHAREMTEKAQAV